MKAPFFALGAMLALAGSQTASASLIIQTYQQFSGTGIGTVPTILTFQNVNTETGCVGQGGAIGSALINGVCSTGGDTKTGNSQTQLQPLTAAGITSLGAAGAASFGLIFNAVEPSGDSISVTSLVAAFYSSTGAFLYQTAGLFCQNTAGGPIVASGAGGCVLPTTGTGTGNSGYLVVLDAAQQAAAVAAGAFGPNGTLVGVSSAAGTTGNPSAGGSETIFLANAGGARPIGQVPEPATYLLVGSALFLVGLTRKVRKA